MTTSLEADTIWVQLRLVRRCGDPNRAKGLVMRAVPKMRATMRRSLLIKSSVALGATLALAAGVYAFTASNTVPSTTAGSGSGTVSGYTVNNVHYTLNATTPSAIDSVTFTVSPSIPSSSSGKVVVQAALTSGGPSTYNCTTNTSGDTVTCNTTSPQLSADKLTSLTVIAAQ
jgi:hypothetical protein